MSLLLQRISKLNYKKMDTQILNQILDELKSIKNTNLLSEKTILTIDDFILLTGLTKSTVYKMTSTNQIPHYKPSGRTLFFEKKDVEEWLRKNRVDSLEESEQKAALHCIKN